ncbi:MAG: GFA family protein [Phenylobacterium sp.]|nr:MAG: GFA family protein [Phenylobacterium sp.]
MSELTGGCPCGAVRYRMMSGPLFVNCCHCQDCQRQVGSAFVINAIIELDRLEVLSGELKAVRMPTESGRAHDVYRCTACDTALWSDYGGMPFRFLRATTLDDRGALAPDAHIFTRSKLPWVQIPADQPAFDVFYDPQVQWPAETQARWQAAMAKR